MCKAIQSMALSLCKHINTYMFPITAWEIIHGNCAHRLIMSHLPRILSSMLGGGLSYHCWWGFGEQAHHEFRRIFACEEKVLTEVWRQLLNLYFWVWSSEINLIPEFLTWGDLQPFNLPFNMAELSIIIRHVVPTGAFCTLITDLGVVVNCQKMPDYQV